MGVTISSRYGKHDEQVQMAEMIAALPHELRADILSVWCDSKATHSFTIEMQPGKDTPSIINQIAACLHAIACHLAGGHNGISVGRSAEVDPDWEEKTCVSCS